MTENLTKAVWGKGLDKTQNLTLAFRLKFQAEKGETASLTLSAKQLYKVILNGKIVHYGPERCAHGYSKVDRLKLGCIGGLNVLVVEVYHAGVFNYYLPFEKAYFSASVEIGNKSYESDDFKCYRYTDRVENSQRYCGQRTFVEDYLQKDCRTKFYLGGDLYPVVDIEETLQDKLIEKDCEYPMLSAYDNFDVIESGWVKEKVKRAKYKLPILNRARKNGEKIDYEVLTDNVNNFIYYRGENKKASSTYKLFAAKREISGFINLELDVVENAEIYLVFDEILMKSKSANGAKKLHFSRCGTANVVRWKLKKGKFSLCTFEAYSFKYVKVVVKSGKIDNLRVSATRYENGAEEKFRCEIQDKELEIIVNSAYNTYRQNAVDLLMDCPSRERAGWINDAWFSMESPTVFSGNDKPFKSLLRAYALAPDLGLPKGMIPMCYPADFRTGLFMVACAMWYVCCLCEYHLIHGEDEIVERGKVQVDNFLKYLRCYENELGLLENVKGKIFVEWSRANTIPYVKGVNFPTNMLYCKTLVCAGKLLGRQSLIDKALKLKKTIIDLSFNGEFFEDNAIRKGGVLTRVGHVTEVCQYYAFECGVAKIDEFKKLYQTLKTEFVPGVSAVDKYSHVTRSNVIIGLCIREKLARENGEYQRMLKEIKSIYLKMAERTETLWEHDKPKASCNHGIAAFAGVCIIKALTGFVGVKDGVVMLKEVQSNIDFDITLPCGSEDIRIISKDGKRSVQTKLQYKII